MVADPKLASLMACLALTSCAVDLESTAPSPAPASPLTLEACNLLSELDGLRGRVLPATLPDGKRLLVAAQPDFDGAKDSAAFETATACGAKATALPTRPIIDVSALGDERTGTPRASFTTDAAYLYFSLDRADGFQSDGAGIARFDDEAGAFVAQALLWTSDRPSYGSSALIDGDYLYVYGGMAARFLAADVYLARVPLPRVTEVGAYEYWQGGGEWTQDPDLAGPLLEGGSMPSVMWHAPTHRYLMAYATPLAREITLRSGLGPAGPWSRPLVWGACALPFEAAFCNEIVFIPSSAEDADLALAQGVTAFEAPAESSASGFWTRLVRGSVPSELP